MVAGGGEGEHLKERGITRKGQRKSGSGVVEKRKTNKESASGTAGFEPQAQSVEVSVSA